ncbi:MFS transporter [Streptomyces sp. NPDC056910]|uniref:MFS transporter n=1 Tax=Streptomyces sp. NPDC056910 TaxID=3345964 RepID=UPI0036883754
MDLYGYVQDKLGLRKNLLYWIGGLMLLVGPMYIYVYGPLLKTHFALGLVVGSVHLTMAFAVAVATLESCTERLGRFHGFEFGRARMFGSLGWAAATFFAGRLFNTTPRSTSGRRPSPPPSSSPSSPRSVSRTASAPLPWTPPPHRSRRSS